MFIGIGLGMGLRSGSSIRYPIFKFDVNSTQVISGAFRTLSASDEILVRWGDGTSDTYSGTSDQAYLKDYGSAGDRTVKIYASSGGVLTSFTMTRATADISFVLSGMPAGMTRLYVSGKNTISGEVDGIPAGMTYLYVLGKNTISGEVDDMPAGMTQLYVLGNNTISGEIDDVPVGMTYLYVHGNNTISGKVDGMPAGMTQLSVHGKNTISGEVDGISAGMTRLSVLGNNTISDYTSPWPTSVLEVVNLQPTSGGLSASEVDQVLIDVDSTVTTWAGSKIITIVGTNAARTSASDAAVVSLQGKGVTVTTNSKGDGDKYIYDPEKDDPPEPDIDVFMESSAPIKRIT